MALLKSCIEVLKPHLADARILALGYPDLAIIDAQLKEVLGFSVMARNASNAEWPETVAVLEALGCTLRCVDVRPSRGVEEVVDLNLPQDLGSYDLVLDAGTIEHCFNIAQALMNAAAAVKPGGLIFHTPPLSMVNHGFYNVCPTLFSDFYIQNGWAIEYMAVLERQGRGAVLEEYHATRRFKAPPECVIHCLARRLTDVAPSAYPQQTKYMLP